MPLITDFRTAVRDLVATAAGITFKIDGERTGPSGVDMVCVWSSGSAPREDNTQFRMIGVTARVILARDPQVGPEDDDPLAAMETIEQNVLAAVTPLIATVRVDNVVTSFDTTLATIDFEFVGEIQNVAPEV